MAITRGAKKAYRNSLKKRVFNLRRKDKVAKAIKAYKKLTTSPGEKRDDKALMEAFRQVQKALDKAVKSKTLKKNTVARKKSRLSKLLKKA